MKEERESRREGDREKFMHIGPSYPVASQI